MRARRGASAAPARSGAGARAMRDGALLGAGQAHAGARASSCARTAAIARDGPVRIGPRRAAWREPARRGSARGSGITQGGRAALALLRGGQPPRLAAHDRASTREPAAGAWPLGRSAAGADRRRSARAAGRPGAGWTAPARGGGGAPELPGCGVAGVDGAAVAVRRASGSRLGFAAPAPPPWAWRTCRRRLACTASSAVGRVAAPASSRCPTARGSEAPLVRRRPAGAALAAGGVFGAFLFDLQRRDHEVVPDQRREGAAEHRPAVELGGHRDQLVGVADPDGDRVLGVPADEPGVAVVGGGAGLAGRELAESRRPCAVPYWSTVSSIEVSVSATSGAAPAWSRRVFDVAVRAVGQRLARRLRLPGCPRARRLRPACR